MSIDCPACPVFNDCIASTYGLSELEWFKEKVVRKIFKKGERIFSENQVATEMFMIIKGNTKFIKDDELPYPITVGISHPGELIGIEAVVSSTYSVTAFCMSDVTICMFDKLHINEIIRKHDSTCQFLFNELLNHVKSMYAQSLIIISGNSSSRVAQALLSLFGNEIKIEITKEEIALMTGSSRETVSRILSEMRLRKIIETNKKLITLLNKAELEQLTKITKRK